MNAGSGNLVINVEGGELSVPFGSETSVKEVLDSTTTLVRSACRGNGACGLCKIKIIQGNVPKPTAAERYHLSNNELNDSIRLACNLTPTDGMRICVVNTAQAFSSTVLKNEDYYLEESLHPAIEAAGYRKRPQYGLAVDLGSTNITASLWDLSARRRLTGRTIANRQKEYGADIMTRIVAASNSKNDAHKLSDRAVDSIGQVIYDICSREAYNPFDISEVIIVGNTAELALLAERGYELLLDPKFWDKEIDCSTEKTANWVSRWCISTDAAIVVIPPIAGFVGSDLLAGVLATDMMTLKSNTLLLDFGTNTEIALWDGENLWVTSAAGGPAFEGSGLSLGIPAGLGAIYKVDTGATPYDFIYHTLPGGFPSGICGSGIVDLIACLLWTHAISSRGKFANRENCEFVLPIGERKLILTERDIDLFMRSKAAIGTGIHVLLNAARLSMNDIIHVFTGGAFGKKLNVQNAIDIGIMPPLESGKIEVCGNTALAGCERFLLYRDDRQALDSVRCKSKVINLANVSDFDDLFLENLFLKPMEGL